MKRVLITGGTVFVSRYTASWFLAHGWSVDVLNRGTRPQVEGVRLICADRHAIGDALRGVHYQAVIDVCAYNAQDVNDLLDALDSFDQYILISSSAVYPETTMQPFHEDAPVGPNSIWGSYGTDKIAAEQALIMRTANACILRPPYLYGPMQNVYREPFVFECALAGRPFCIPGDGSMRLQFFHVEDLCRVIAAVLEKHPEWLVLNVGNEKTVDIRTFVETCYRVAGISCQLISVPKDVSQRSYFSFHDYTYQLDVSRQKTILSTETPLEDGLRSSYEWYVAHTNDVHRKDYIRFIDENGLISR